MPTLRWTLNEADVQWTAVRAQGAGGQNVNKVSSAVHLRFDIASSQLSDALKERLLSLRDHRITQEGVVIIKAQSHRSQEMNHADALERLQALIAEAAHIPEIRRPTKPTRSSQRRRVDSKKRDGETKVLRKRVDW